MEIPVASLQAIFDQAALGVGLASPAGDWQLLNDRFCEIVGRSREELLGSSYRDITHADDRGSSDEVARRLLAGEISLSELEKRYVRKDGSVAWARLCVSLVRDHDNRPQYFVSVIEDVTEKIRAEQALKDSERRLELALGAAGIGFWERDLRTDVTTISGEYLRLHALAPNHPPLTHEEWLKLVHPDDRNRVDEEYRQSLERTHYWDTEFRLLWPDGSVHWILAKGQVFLDDEGHPVRLAGVSMEVTERKRVEEQRSHLASIVDSCEDAIFSKDLDGAILSWNAGAERLFGYPAEEILGKPMSLLLPPEHLDEFPKILERIRSGACLEHHEVTRMRKDCRRVEISVTISPIKDSTGALIGSSAIAREITDRKRAEAALRQSEERFRLAIKATNDAIWDIDVESGVVSWNETYSTLYGRPAETSDSWQWWIDRIHPEDREVTVGGLRAAISSSASSWTCEYRFRRVDGQWAHIYDRAYIACDASDTAWRVIGAMQDLTERKQAEVALRESEERFRRVFEEGPLGLALGGRDYRFLKVNNALCQMLGYQEAELLQMSFTDITHPEDLRADVELSERLFRREIPFYRMQKRYVRKSGEIIWINLTATVIVDRDGESLYGLAMIENITEVKRTQEEALARQKLESVGTLAGGIAHDFNNLLGGVQAQAELALTELDAGSSCREQLKAICEVAKRGSEIVRQLMIYAGKESEVVGTNSASCHEPDHERLGRDRRSRWSDSGDHKTRNPTGIGGTLRIAV